MAYQIFYISNCWNEVRRIAKDDLIRIKKSIENRLSLAPDRLGQALKGSLRGAWRMRVGDYRVIYKIDKQNVIILKIGNRKDIYE